MNNQITKIISQNRNIEISSDKNLEFVIDKLNKNLIKTCFVLKNKKLIGSVTDGDIRRSILKNISKKTPIKEIMNKKPMKINNSDKNFINKLSKYVAKKKIYIFPVVNKNNQYLGFIDYDRKYINVSSISNRYDVVIMAGGFGKRLRPLTKNKPKPLVELDTQPILEKIIEQFKNQGFWNFHISVNHMANQIIDYFGDGEKWGVKIQYLKEKEKLGTAGALSLLSKKANCPIIVMNADLLTSVKFKHFVDFHFEQDSFASMAVREYEFNVPFGVLNLEQENITNIQEKPSQKFFVNAGIYVLSPQVLDILEPGKHIDMTQLFSKLIEMKKKVVAFPIREYWLDIGQPKDLERAQTDVKKHF